MQASFIEGSVNVDSLTMMKMTIPVWLMQHSYEPNDDLYQAQVAGNNNQVISNNFGTAIGNAEKVFLNQAQPKVLSLHRLPADIADFTGREDQIERIVEHLKSSETVGICAVAGMPGVGKSALAIHVAHKLTEAEFPDMQLHIDLRGVDGNALEPSDVLAAWLRWVFALDESLIPQSLQERSAMYRSLLSGKRAIIVLDNARDEAQVRPLLPGSATCAVIVTSRRVLGALEGSKFINLPTLPKLKALDFLKKSIDASRVNKELVAATEIVQLCGLLPLAIRIVGGTLKIKLHWTLSEYAHRLVEEKERLSHLKLSDLDVRASFELSYQELSESDAELFYYLGILEGKQFGQALASSLIDGNSGVLDRLERLADTQLLEALGDQRYQFHDLIRLFAREKLNRLVTPKQQISIKQSFIKSLIELSGFVDYLLIPKNRKKIVDYLLIPKNRKKIYQEANRINKNLLPETKESLLNITQFSINLIAIEREHLRCALAWSNDLQLWKELIALTVNLTNFFDKTSYWKDWEQFCTSAIVAAKNIYVEGSMYNNLGVCQNQSSGKRPGVPIKKV